MRTSGVPGLKMASAYAHALNAGLAIVAKQRKSATETEAQYVIGEVEGCDILLADDLTETAGTLTSAATILKKLLISISLALYSYWAARQSDYLRNDYSPALKRRFAFLPSGHPELYFPYPAKQYVHPRD